MIYTYILKLMEIIFQRNNGKLLLPLIILCSCGTEVSSNSLGGGVLISSGSDYDPTITSVEDSTSELITTSSEIVEVCAEIKGEYTGDDQLSSSKIVLTITGDGALKLECDESYNEDKVELNFTFESRNNDFYYFNYEENKLEVYLFPGNHKRLSVSLNEGICDTTIGIWLENTEFFARGK